MTRAMEQKISFIDEYVEKLDIVISNNNSAEAKALGVEIIAVFDAEIDSLKNELDCYSMSIFYGNSPNYINDAKLLRAKLINYKLNLAAGISGASQENTVNITQQVNQDVNNVVNITLDQVINTINVLQSNELSDEEKEILSGKLASISAEKDRQKKWEKVGNTLKWIAEKSIEVGKVALPYIVQSLGAGS